MKNALCSLPLLLAVGCCGTFDQDFDDARPRAQGMVGAWEGTWSNASGHEGGLRCIVTPAGENKVDTRYHATYGWFIFWFSFEYTVPVTIERDGTGWKFKGSAVLDSWVGGGLYEYQGRVDGDAFDATYTSEHDPGVFKMKRAGPKPE